MKRVFLIVLDSVGAGALPDAALYGDEGANTLAHTLQAVSPDLPNLTAMGWGTSRKSPGRARPTRWALTAARRSAAPARIPRPATGKCAA